jgi:hypothetical protein
MPPPGGTYMFEILLHTGTEHPDLTLPVLSGLILFVTGLGLGIFRERIGSFVRTMVPGLTK